jgi:hypothetical protein
MLYLIIRSLHIMGAVGMFMALGVDLVALSALSSARTTDQARRALAAYRINAVIGPLSLLLILVPGIYMAMTSWGPQPWISASMLGIVVIIVLGATLSRRPLAALRGALKGDDRRLGPDLEAQAQHPLLWTSFFVRGCLALGILMLMSMKPDRPLALMMLTTAAALGVVVSLPFWSRTRRAAVSQPSA